MVFAWFSVKKLTMYVYTEICGYSHDFCEKVEHAFYRNSINKITYQFSTNHQISFIQMLRYDAILPHVLNSVWGSLQVHKVMWILKSLQDCKAMFENYKVMLPQISLQDCSPKTGFKKIGQILLSSYLFLGILSFPEFLVFVVVVYIICYYCINLSFSIFNCCTFHYIKYWIGT